MKVIDILQRIAKGEEALLIKYRDKILHWNKDKDSFEDNYGMNTLYEIDFSELNDEIEVIEDKKIEKLIIGKDDVAWCEGNMKTDEEMVDIVLEIKDKINEIIDYINGGTNGE